MKFRPLITFVLGTRPEAIKLAPLILAFRKSKKIDIRLILTGQHREMVKSVLKFFEINFDLDLHIMKPSQTLTYITCATLEGLNKDFVENKPSLLIIQGDTTTAFTASLAAFYQKIPVAHVEAGLRTSDLMNPYPEECNRRLISKIAKLHFAPTLNAVKNLKKDNVDGDIFLTGNTVIDSLLYVAPKIKEFQEEDIDLINKKIILLTVHRRENWGANIYEIIKAVKLLIEKYDDLLFLIPMHPNKIVSEPIIKNLGDSSKVLLKEPLNYQNLVSVIKKCYFVLTDSGGLQEEAPSLGKPVLVLRENTERIESIHAGVAKLVGTKSQNIFFECESLINDQEKYNNMSKSTNPYGNGNASNLIFDACEKFLGL